MFARFSLPRSAEVDSELIFRLADSTLDQGRIDINALKSRLTLCKGTISAVMASILNPKEVVIIKGNKPLEVQYNKSHQVIVYASDARYLNVALACQKGWKHINLNMMRIAMLTCDCLDSLYSEPFEFYSSIGRSHC